MTLRINDYNIQAPIFSKLKLWHLSSRKCRRTVKFRAIRSAKHWPVPRDRS